MGIIWATRGKNWGNCFLMDGGFQDPLPEYLSAFSGLENSREVFQKMGDRVIMRFEDPEGRRDCSGRPIEHDFVIDGPELEAKSTLEEARDFVWPLVAGQYEKCWAEDSV